MGISITTITMIATATESSPHITARKPGTGSFQRRLLDFLIRIHNKYFVVIWILIAILTALAYPDAGIKKGPMKPEITADWVAVIIIFLISGLKIKTQDFLKAAQACYETIVVQLFVFILFPCVGYLIYTLMGVWNMDAKLSIGVMLLSCCPTTVSTANIMVQMAGGNEAIAIINTKLNNFIGIIMTPSLILFFLHQDTNVDFLETIIELILSVAVPILVGQILRYLIPAVAPFTKNHKKLVSRTSTMMIVYIVWATFSETFYNGIEATWKDMLATEGLLLVMFLTGHIIPWLFSFFVMNNTRDIKVAVVICSGQKNSRNGSSIVDENVPE